MATEKHSAIFGLFFFCLILSLLIIPAAEAGKGHEECSMCHGVHTSKNIALFPKQIKTGMKNPYSDRDLATIDALCMTCHSPEPYGDGIRVIDLEKKHPFGIKPNMVDLPIEATDFGGQEGYLSCMGCHDPHPSNQNWTYLRTPEGITISNQKDTFKFCIWCHPEMKTWLNVIPDTIQEMPKKKIKGKKAKPVFTPPLGG